MLFRSNGKVAPGVAAHRVQRLGELSSRLYRGFCAAQQGREAKVLWESTRRGGDMFGFTENYIKVRTPFDRERINTITRVRLGALDADGVAQATILSE